MLLYDISLDKASLVGFWVESVLYGAYAVLFALCIYILFFVRRNTHGLNKPMLFTAIAMFVVSTAHMVVDIIRVITAFIGDSDEAGGAINYLAQTWQPLSMLRQALYATNNIIADGWLIYRCYVVWDFQWRIVFIPIVMLVATTVCFAFRLCDLSQTAFGKTFSGPNNVDWGLAVFSVPLATNMLVTCLIASRVYWIARRSETLMGGENRRKYNQAIVIIVESGAIQSAAICILLVMYGLKEISQDIVADGLAQLMGIVPTLIIVRCGLCTRLPCEKPSQKGTLSSHSFAYPSTMQLPKSIDANESMASIGDIILKGV